MPSLRNQSRGKPYTFYLPADLAQRMEEFLHSDVKGGRPYNALSAFITERVEEFFRGAPTLDLSVHLGPGGEVKGRPEVLAKLATLLEEKA